MELYRSAEYKELSPKMQVYQDMYDGDHAVLTGGNYLIRHALETTTDGGDLLALRMNRTRYRNFIEPIISAFIAMAFKNPIDTSEVEDIFTPEIITNIDGQNTSLTDFIKNQVARDYFLLGNPYILTDAPPNPTRPYWVSLSPLSVKDYQTTPFSSDLNAIRYEYYEADPRANLEIEEKIRLKSKQYFIADGKVQVQEYIKEDKSESFAKGKQYTIDIDKIPVARTSNNKSWVHDACEEARRYHNQLSMRDNVLNHQGYQRSYIAGDVDQEKRKLVNEYVTGVLPEGAQVFTVDSADTSSMEKALEQSQVAVFQIAFNMQRVLPVDAKGVQGEGTISENKKELRDLVVTAIQEITDVVNKAVQHFAMFQNKKNYEGKIKISTDLTVEDIDSVLKTLPISKPYMSKVPTWEKAIVRKLVKSQQLPEEKEILIEVEAADFKQVANDSALQNVARG